SCAPACAIILVLCPLSLRPTPLPPLRAPSLRLLLLRPPPPPASLFPYTTLFRSPDLICICQPGGKCRRAPRRCSKLKRLLIAARDRKSTRLNSSHVSISYAVFCLKKKNTSTPASAVESTE